MEIIPAHPSDQFLPIPNTRTRTFFIIRDQLDEHALRDALDRLIRRHWRILGARIVKDPARGYEYHLPGTFEDGHKLFEWSSSKVDTTVEEALPWLEAPTIDGVSVLPSLEEVDKIFRPASWPFELKNDPEDGPQLYVHLTFFDNVTVLAINTPHVLADQLGTSNLFKAWLGLAAGRDPPPYLHDAIPIDKEYHEYPEEKRYRKGWTRVRKRFERIQVVLGLIPDFIFWPKEQPGMLFLPESMIEELRARFTDELLDKHGEATKVSRQDVMTAILTKFSRFNDTRPQWVSLSQSINTRYRLPEMSGDKMGGYLGTSIVYGTARILIDATTPLSEIAHANRKAVEKALEPEEIHMQFAIHREMVRLGQPIHACEPWEYSYSVTSWAGAWNGIDFSSVGSQKGAAPEFHVLGASGEKGAPRRFDSCIMSKAQGGYWVDFHAEAGNYEAIKAYLARDPKLENL